MIDIQKPDDGGAANLAYLRSKKIVVVDDAFDPPEVATLDPAEVDEFFKDCASDGAARDELIAAFGIEPEKPVALTAESLQRLWAMRSQDSRLAAVAKTTILSDAVDRLSNVTPFCEHLRALGFEVLEIGQDGNIPKDGVGLVLIDYILGREVAASSPAEALDVKFEAVQRSEAVTDRYYLQFSADADKPFIVLMSSRPKVDVLVERFRENSNLIGGLFDFISKTELCDPATLEFKLRTWNYSLPARHDIQRFVDALLSAMKDLGDSFRSSIMSLSFEDYAYIQELALQEDGHPLGDYMLWLYSSRLTDLLLTHPAVAKQRVKLDQMELSLVPTQQPPSVGVAALYHAAVSAVIPGGPQPHPREDAPQPGEGAPAPAMPYLQLGQVFVNGDQRTARMVLNAACDLAFAPHSSRSGDPDQSILFIHGTLVPLYERVDDMSLPRTELFALSDALFRIVWHPDRALSLAHRDVASRMAADGYELKSQLRLPFALQIQQAFAAGLTRVGLPVAPPICIAVDVDLHCTGDDGAARKLGPTIHGGAFVVHRKAGKTFVREFVLTSRTVEAFLQRSEELAEQQLRTPAAPVPDGTDDATAKAGEEKRIARLTQRAAEVREHRSRHNFLFSLVSELRAVPSPDGKIVIEASFLDVTARAAIDGVWKGNPVLIANLHYGPQPVEVASAGPTERPGDE